MNEHIDARRKIITITFAVVLVLGVSALIAGLTSDQGLGLAVLGGLTIVLFVFAAGVPGARKDFFSKAEQRVNARDWPALFLMLALVWVVPGLLGHFEVVPEGTAFPLAFTAFLLVGLPVLGWHHGQVIEERQREKNRAFEGETALDGPRRTDATEPTSSAEAKGLGVSLLGYWWSLIPGATAGLLIAYSALNISGRLERTQLLEITNIGSKPVTVGEGSLHSGVKYLACLPDETPIVVEGRQVATFQLKPRTAEVEKTESGRIEFRFTDE